MRVEFLLFAAILFACVNTSSTNSISTTARSLTSKQEDVAAHGVGVETIKEERAPILLGFDKINEAKAPNYMEKMLYKILQVNEKNGVDAYKFLHLDKENINWLRNERYNAWLKYLGKRANSSLSMKKLSSEDVKLKEEKGILKLLDEIRQDPPSHQKLRAEVESVLLNSWEEGKRSSLSVFKQLGLHVKPPSDHSVNVDLLELWVRYVEKKNNQSPETEMAEVINGYDDEIRVMVLDSLRNIKGTERVVDFIGKSLLSSWAESKVSVEDVYATLNLAKVQDESNFILWVYHVIKVCKTSELKAKSLYELSRAYDETGPVTIFLALRIYNVRKDLQDDMMSSMVSSWIAEKKTESQVQHILYYSAKPAGDHKLIGRFQLYEAFMKMKKDKEMQT